MPEVCIRLQALVRKHVFVERPKQHQHAISATLKKLYCLLKTMPLE